MIKKVILITFFLAGLIYLLWPGPSSIADIPAIPNSLKSDEPGDTTQIPNITAYFSQDTRDQVTPFYYNNFSYLNFLGFKVPPIGFNYRVEESKVRVRDQIQTTYLEEYAYPFRDSLYVNGYDKVIWNSLNHIPTDDKNKDIIINGESFNSKITLRYYHSSLFWRVIIYILTWAILIALIKVSVRAFRKY